MVVLFVGIPGVDAGTLPRSNENLEFVAVESLAQALAFLGARSCDAVLIGAEAPDMIPDRLSALALRNVVTPAWSPTGAASTEDRGDDGARERGEVVENVFRRGSIRDMERLMILDRLARLNQNRTRSAESLEISVRTLRNKLRDYRNQVASLVGANSESG
jgi:hypothetical protein